MQQFLQKLIACLRQRSARRPAPSQARRARLDVEAMEAREVPSASILPLHAPALAPPLVAPAAQPHSTGGTHGIVTPEKCVHGYKWRNPIYYPRVVDTQPPRETTAVLPSHPIVVSPQTLPHQAELVFHLAVGGTDGTTVLTGHGTMLVHLPEGPLPTEALARVH